VAGGGATHLRPSGFEHEPSTDELGGIGVRLRHELVYPAAAPAGDLDVALLVHIELMGAEEAAGKPT